MSRKRYSHCAVLSTGLLVFVGILVSSCATPQIITDEPASTTKASLSPTRTPDSILPSPTPAHTATPSQHFSPVELSHPILNADVLEPGSHSGFSYLTANGEEIRYLLYMPENYTQDTQWPLIVFFHGYNSIGSSLDLLINRTPLEYIDSVEEFPFILISPQLPSGFWTKYIDPVDELIDHLSTILAVDQKRYYLTGFSAGGYGVWNYALKYPERFAAVAVISGTSSLSTSDPVPDNICTLKEVPLWVFHGDADTVILPAYSQAVVDELLACEGNVKFTLYSETQHHEARMNAFSDPTFYEWLLSNHR